MSQVLTFIASWFRRHGVRVSLRLDRSGIGAHLLWSITNADEAPITIVRLVLRDVHGTIATIVLQPARTVGVGDTVLLPTDADWNLLGAHDVAAVDETDREHMAPRPQLVAIQERLRHAIDRRRAAPGSASEFLAGAASFAFGVVILGLGVFMLMWVIATG